MFLNAVALYFVQINDLQHWGNPIIVYFVIIFSLYNLRHNLPLSHLTNIVVIFEKQILHRNIFLSDSLTINYTFVEQLDSYRKINRPKFSMIREQKIIAMGIFYFWMEFTFTCRVISFCRNDEYFPLFINTHTNKPRRTKHGSKNKLCYYGWHKDFIIPQ